MRKCGESFRKQKSYSHLKVEPRQKLNEVEKKKPSKSIYAINVKLILKWA